MKSFILTISLLAFLSLCNACISEKDESCATTRDISLLYETPAPFVLNSLRILLFDKNELLVEEQKYTSYPTVLRSPVGSYFFVFVANAPLDTDLYALKCGVTKRSDYLHALSLDAQGNYYQSVPEYYFYTTPQAVELNTTTLTVPLARSVGMLNITLTPDPQMTTVYANIENPVQAIDFTGSAAGVATGKRIRQKLDLGVNGLFTGNIRCFPQQNIQLTYDVVYTQGASQTYPILQPVHIVANQSTQVSTFFSKTVSSVINYTSWTDSIALTYYAGLQAQITVDGGNPVNYNGLSVRIKNNATNITTQYDSIPLSYQNGKLSFKVSQLIGAGNFTLTYACLHDRDGKLFDPNKRGTVLNTSFVIPGKNVTLALDGRQNEEEAQIRTVMDSIHGSVSTGSIWPGASAYLQRCVPLTLPTQVEGFLQKQWTTPSYLNTGIVGPNSYFIGITVTSGEWRITDFDMQSDLYAFAGGIYDNRFTGGGIPYPLFAQFQYLAQLNVAKVNIQFGNNLTPLLNIKRLNYVILNCDAIPSVNKYSGTLSASLSTIDMMHFELNYSNLSGSLPTEYGNWLNLEFLHIMGNASLTGALPASYALFPKITMMRITINGLTGAIPSSFENYATMNVGINFNANKFTCSPPLFLARYNTNVSSQQTGTIGACY